VSGITNIGGVENSAEEDGVVFGVGDKLGVDGEDGASGEGKATGNVQLIVVETRKPIVVSTVSMCNNV